MINPQNGTVVIIPHREDSYERLTDECYLQFADESENTEDKAIATLLIDKLRDAIMTLNDTE